MTKTKLPKTEHYLTWRVPRQIDGETRLLIPRSDPYEHEHPMDLLFENEEEALEALETYEAEDEAREEGWVLCEQVTTPIRKAP